MTYGIRITNSNGETQIDSDHRNYRVMGKGSTTLNRSGIATINFIGEQSIIAYRWTPNKYIVFGNLRFGKQSICCLDNNTFVEWMVLGLDDSSTIGNAYGAAIFDANAKCVFSTNREYARVLDVPARTNWVLLGGGANPPAPWVWSPVNTLNFPSNAFVVPSSALTRPKFEGEIIASALTVGTVDVVGTMGFGVKSDTLSDNQYEPLNLTIVGSGTLPNGPFFNTAVLILAPPL